MITLKDITPIKKVDINYYSEGIDYQKTYTGIQFHAFMLAQMHKHDYDSMFDLVIATCKPILRKEKELRDLKRIEAFEVILFDEFGYKQRITK